MAGQLDLISEKTPSCCFTDGETLEECYDSLNFDSSH